MVKLSLVEHASLGRWAASKVIAGFCRNKGKNNSPIT